LKVTRRGRKKREEEEGGRSEQEDRMRSEIASSGEEIKEQEGCDVFNRSGSSNEEV
jgi:hypothetical protein